MKLKIKIMQYNVQDLFLDLAYPIEPNDINNLSESQWQLLGATVVPLKPLFKLKAISEIIRMEKPDVICLCELGRAVSLHNFNRLFLQEQYEVFIIEGLSERGIDNGFLLRKSSPFTAKIVSHMDWSLKFRYLHEQDPVTHALKAEIAQYVELGNPDDRRMSRDVPALQLYDETDKLRLIILLTHLKSKFDPDGIDPEGQVRRSAELLALLEIYQKTLKQHPQSLVIIAGDFNGKASLPDPDPEFKPIYEKTNLQDVLELASIPHYERYTHLTFLQDSTIAKQLDYIFVPQELQKQLILNETYVYRYRDFSNCKEVMPPFSFQDRQKLPSDHYPLVTAFYL